MEELVRNPLGAPEELQRRSQPGVEQESSGPPEGGFVRESFGKGKVGLDRGKKCGRGWTWGESVIASFRRRGARSRAFCRGAFKTTWLLSISGHRGH
ncbi:hypothetical protein M0804_011135 [Polistes exclamans]|nr:hypothetical protein M0804_011135 [Polistes exclamans]